MVTRSSVLRWLYWVDMATPYMRCCTCSLRPPITHQLFKNFVAKYRPQLAIDEVATGEVWLGVAAVEKQLVDELKTSDEYLSERAKNAHLYHVHYAQRKSLQERVGLAASTSAEHVIDSVWRRLTQRFF